MLVEKSTHLETEPGKEKSYRDQRSISFDTPSVDARERNRNLVANPGYFRGKGARHRESQASFIDQMKKLPLWRLFEPGAIWISGNDLGIPGPLDQNSAYEDLAGYKLVCRKVVAVNYYGASPSIETFRFNPKTRKAFLQWPLTGASSKNSQGRPPKAGDLLDSTRRMLATQMPESVFAFNPK